MRGFSLVELSIVLVILGLLVGGILAGQNLIRASELRAVSTEIDRFSSAVNAFRDKYFAIPGDFDKAEAFWGTDSNCPGDNSTPSTGTATCDGDADGKIESGVGMERYRFWHHLANAGMVEGSYTGVRAGSNDNHIEGGVNTPMSKVGHASYAVSHGDNLDSTAYYTDNFKSHVMQLNSASLAIISNAGNVLRAEEAWNLDTKMDDEQPGFGTVRSRKPSSSASPNCASNDDPTLSQYIATDTNINCVLVFDMGF